MCRSYSLNKFITQRQKASSVTRDDFRCFNRVGSNFTETTAGSCKDLSVKRYWFRLISISNEISLQTQTFLMEFRSLNHLPGIWIVSNTFRSIIPQRLGALLRIVEHSLPRIYSVSVDSPVCLKLLLLHQVFWPVCSCVGVCVMHKLFSSSCCCESGRNHQRFKW